MSQMKKIHLLVIVLSLCHFQFIDPIFTHPPLKVDESKLPMSTFELKNVDGKLYSLENLKKEKGLLVIYSANSCPFVVGNGKSEGWETRYPRVYEFAKSNNVGMVLINSNHAMREGKDSFENMVVRAEKKHYQWPYLYDDQNQLADAFAARTTPHVFLFDKDLTLVYKGAIDDNVANSEKVKKHFLTDALKSLGANEPIKVKTSRNFGCSIKRFSY